MRAESPTSVPAIQSTLDYYVNKPVINLALIPPSHEEVRDFYIKQWYDKVGHMKRVGHKFGR